MSGEHTHCPYCGDDLCQVDCKDALMDRIANYGIDLIAKDRHIAEVASENGRLGLQVEIDKDRIAELTAAHRELIEAVEKLPELVEDEIRNFTMSHCNADGDHLRMFDLMPDGHEKETIDDIVDQVCGAVVDAIRAARQKKDLRRGLRCKDSEGRRQLP